MGIIKGLACGALCVALLGIHSSVHGRDAMQPILRPFGNIALRGPEIPKPGTPARLYSETGPAPEWEIVQWNIPDKELSPFAARTEGGTTVYTASSPEASVRIIRRDDGEVVELAQNGAVLPCTAKDGAPLEADLFLQPRGRGERGNNPFLTDRLPMRRLSSVKLTADVTLTGGPGPGVARCPVTQGNSIVALVLTDFIAKPAQALYYQLGFWEPCGAGSAERVRVCRAGQQAPAYFLRTNPFGVGDRLPLLGIPLPAHGQRQTITVELGSRLRELISSGPQGMDKVPDHWSLESLYFGNEIWGDYRLKSVWHQVQITVSKRSSSADGRAGDRKRLR